MRVVLDTNILISACWKAGGLEEQLVQRCLAGHLQAIVSPDLWAEYEEVLRRPKFSSLKPRVDKLLANLEPILLRVTPTQKLLLALDPDDNLILECAQAGHASHIITGNLKHFPLDWPVARICNARQFLEECG
jgi:uncharacterized protein